MFLRRHFLLRHLMSEEQQPREEEEKSQNKVFGCFEHFCSAILRHPEKSWQRTAGGKWDGEGWRRKGGVMANCMTTGMDGEGDNVRMAQWKRWRRVG